MTGVDRDIPVQWTGERWPALLVPWLMRLLLIGFAFSISLTEVSKGMLLLVWLVMLVRFPNARRRLAVHDWLLLAFIFWLILSATVHMSPAVIKRLPHYLSQVLLFFVAATMFRFPDFTRALLVGIWAVALAGLYSLLQFFIGLHLPSCSLLTIPGSARGARATGAFIHPNYNAQALSSLVFLLPLRYWSGWRNRVLLAVLAAAALGGLVVTGTRSAWLGALVAGIAFAVIAWDWRRVVPALLVLGGLAFLLMPPNLRSRLERSLNLGGTEYRLRGVIYQAGWQMAVDNPLFGVGPGNFAEAYRNRYLPALLREGTFTKREQRDLGHHFHSHNNLINLAAGCGFVGLGLFLAFCISLVALLLARIRECGEPWQRNLPFLALLILISLFIQGLFDHTLFGVVGGNVFWFAAGMGAGAGIFPEQKRRIAGT